MDKRKKRIVTPTCAGKIVPAIVERYENRIYWNGLIDTKHYPGAGVLEVWQGRKD